MRLLLELWGILKSRIIYDFKPFNQRKMIRFYSSFIKKGDLCFDIGAHTGNRTAAWLSMGSKVVALEPQPTFSLLLKKKFTKYTGATLLAEAAGDKQGEAILMISSLNPAISTISANWVRTIKDFQPSVKWDTKVKVNVTTLDNLIHTYGVPVFCKIDVEGFEEEVLTGLSSPLPALSFEFFPTTPSRTINCLKRLEELGVYKYNWSFRESFQFSSDEWMNEKNMSLAILDYKGHKSGDIYAILQ